MIKRRKSHAKRFFALFLCRCKKDLRRDHHEGAKTSAMMMTAAKPRSGEGLCRDDRREAAITTKKDRRPWDVAFIAGKGAARQAQGCRR